MRSAVKTFLEEKKARGKRGAEQNSRYGFSDLTLNIPQSLEILKRNRENVLQKITASVSLQR